MDKIYIDYSIISAFFDKKNEFHASAVQIISCLLLQQDQYVISPTHLFKAVSELTSQYKKPQEDKLLPENFDIETEVIKKITDFCRKIDLQTIENSNARLLEQVFSLAKEHNISLEMANTLATLMDTRVHIVASFNEEFEPLFTEGILVRYQP